MENLYHAPARAQARSHLCRSDPVMRTLVERYGDLWPQAPGSRLQGLVGVVLDQQISVHAAAAIRGRLRARLRGRWTAAALLALSESDWIACGLSRAKRRTVCELAAAIRAGELNLARLARLEDAQVMDALTQLRGIGPWTAQMYLLFVLGRADILAPADLGLQNAARTQYGLRSRPDARRFERLAEAWRPYRSLASVYLWASLERGNWRPRERPS